MELDEVEPLNESDPHPDSDPDFDPSDDSGDSDDEQKPRKQAVPEHLMDRAANTKGSYRICEALLKVGVEIAGGKPRNYSLSRSSLWLKMTKLRSEQKEKLHSLLADDNCDVIIQIDGKRYKKIDARHLGSKERLIVMCHTAKYDVPLGLFKVDSKSGVHCVPVIMNAIDRHSLRRRVVAIVSDTEISNTYT